MNVSLMTFEEVRAMQTVNINGGNIEYVHQGKIYRAILVNIEWWRNISPKRFCLDRIRCWSEKKGRWFPTECFTLTFKFEFVEEYTGPFVDSDGRIFVILSSSCAYTILPKPLKFTRLPRQLSEYVPLNKENFTNCLNF